MMFRTSFIVVLACVLLVCSGTVLASCPCSSDNLCKPITKSYDKELVVFACSSDNGWKSYNWSEITHVISCAEKTNTELYCFAHSKQVRVTVIVGTNPEKDFPRLGNTSFQEELVSGWIHKMTTGYFDGINIDIEGAAYTSTVIEGINQVTKLAFQQVKQLNPAYVVTWDVAYSPFLAGCISAYCYDYVTISKYCDYMISMDYDATIDLLVAQANSPFNLISEGFDFYLNNLSINPAQLVMAVPWYGYDYTCSKFFNRTGHNLCLIVGADHTQRCFSDIAAMIEHYKTPVMFDELSESPFTTINNDGVFHQLWFDDMRSLSFKFQLAVKLNLRGLSMFRADCLNYTSTDPAIRRQTVDMWNLISYFMTMFR